MLSNFRSYKLAVEFYGKAKAKELKPAHVKDQFRRAALSIALNLAEATGKQSMPDRVRFFQIAMGSIRECQSLMELEKEQFSELEQDLIDHLAASTYKLIRNSMCVQPRFRYRPPQRPPAATPLTQASLIHRWRFRTSLQSHSKLN